MKGGESNARKRFY